MHPVEVTGKDSEPIWDEFGIERCDFRRHWNGDLVNLFSVVGPKGSEFDTECFMKGCARSLARWIIDHRDQFGTEDRFQLVVGWPKSVREYARQTIKIGGTFEDIRRIADGVLEVPMRRGWSAGLFTQMDQANKVT